MLHDTQGVAHMSTPQFARIVKINGQDWVDALHWESEVPGYFTRYLATLNDTTSLLVTFTADKAHFEQFNGQMEPLIGQMKLMK
jgi:hypothetical protein